ncbi:ABC transporter permease [Chloroflexota bacterium]
MWKYIAGRLLLSIPTLIGVTIVIFVAMRILPGDPIAAMFGEEGGTLISDHDRAKIEESLGLRKPLYLQYLSWMSDIFRGRFGESFWRGDRISVQIMRRGFISLEIAIIAVTFSWVIGLPVGVLSALRQDSWLDYALRIPTVVFLAIPNFWLASIIVLVFIRAFDYMAPLGQVQFPWTNPVQNLQQVVPAGIVIGTSLAAVVARMSRSTFLEVIREDYIRTARAKGLSVGMVMFRHALRNAVLPVITLSAISLAHLIGGAVTTETAFNVPGLGKYLVDAQVERDFNVVQNLVFVYAVVFLLVNLAVDLVYSWIDPRIRYA